MVSMTARTTIGGRTNTSTVLPFPRDASVATPAAGVAHLVDLVRNGNRSLFVDGPARGNSGDDMSIGPSDVDEVRHTLRALAGESIDEIQQFFQARYDVPLVGTTSSPGLFTIRGGRGGSTSGRSGNRSRRTRATNLNIGAGAVNDVKLFRKVLANDKYPIPDESGMLWCDRVIEHPRENLANLSCFYLAMCLRFHRGAFFDAVRKAMEKDFIPQGENLPKKIWAVQRDHIQPNTFIYRMAKVIATERRMPEPTFDMLRMPVTETEVLLVCEYFDIGIAVLEPGSLERYIEFNHDNPQFSVQAMSAVNDRADLRTYHTTDASHVRCVLMFNGKKLRESHKDKAIQGMVMIGSYFQDEEKHVDALLNRHKERLILSMNHTSIVISYDWKCGERTTYGEKASRMVEMQKIKPDPKWMEATPLGFEHFNHKSTGRGYQFLENDWEEFEHIADALVDVLTGYKDALEEERSKPQPKTNSKKRVNPHLFIVHDLIPSSIFLGKDFCFTNQTELEKDAKDKGGMIYVFSHLYRKFMDAGLENFVQMHRFTSSRTPRHIRNVFTHRMKSSSLVKQGNRFDYVIGFDDLASFDIWCGQGDFVCRFSRMDPDVHTFATSLVSSHPYIKTDVERYVQSQLRKKHKDKQRKFDSKEIKDYMDLYMDMDGFTRAMASTNPVFDIVLRDKALSKVFSSVYSTFPSIVMQNFIFLDQQYDEPPPLEVGKMPDRDDRHTIVDMNSFYTAVLCGHWDKALVCDFYREPWLHGSMKRPSYVCDPTIVLKSYLYDYGMVFLKEIDLDKLRRAIPNMPVTLGWEKFAYRRDKEPSYQRFVLNSAVIHLCSYTYEWAEKYREGYAREQWYKFVQHDVLHVKHFMFNLTPSERRFLERIYKREPSSARSRDNLIKEHAPSLVNGLKMIYRRVSANKGVTDGPIPSIQSFKKQFKDNIQDLYRYVPTLEDGAKGKRKFMKKLVNSAFGQMKAVVHGDVDTSRVSDYCSVTDHDQDASVETRVPVTIPEKPSVKDMLMRVSQMMILGTCDIPGTDLALTELISARPIQQCGTLRGCRVDLLTRAWMIMDHYSFLTKPVAVKTDALWFDRIVDFKEKVKEDIERVNPPNWDKSWVQDYSTLRDMPPFSVERHHEDGILQVFQPPSFLDAVQDAAPRKRPRTEDSISTEGHDWLNAPQLVEQTIYKASEIWASCGEECTLESHFEYLNDGSHAELRDKLDDKLKKILVDTKGLVIEGPPGAGKSTLIRSYINQLTKDDSTRVCVTTPNHLTLQPYHELARKCNNMYTMTFHSYVGVYNEMPKVANSPRQYFLSNEGKNRAKFLKNMPTGRDILIVDEYEMLPVHAEEILLMLYQVYKVEIILVGDRHQTAPISRGIRYDSEVVRKFTNNTTLFMDLQYRNPSLSFHRRLERCKVDPLEYLQIGKYIEDGKGYEELVKDIAAAWVDSSRTKKPMEFVTSSPDYKRMAVFVLGVLEALHTSGHITSGTHFLIHTGMQSHTKACEDIGEDFLEEEEEQMNRAQHMEHRQNYYLANCSHAPASNDFYRTATWNGPSGKSFLVGTHLYLIPNHEYMCLGKLVPAVQDKRDKVKAVIYQGERVRFRRTWTLSYEDLRRPKQASRCTAYEFYSGCKKYILTEFEVRARLFYPFCLYQDGVVGHTFDRYVMMNTVIPGQMGWYSSTRKRLLRASSVMAEDVWMSKPVKQLNVAVTRVRNSDNVCVMDITETDKTYWQTPVYRSKHHVAGKLVAMDDGYVGSFGPTQELYNKMRVSVLQSQITKGEYEFNGPDRGPMPEMETEYFEGPSFQDFIDKYG